MVRKPKTAKLDLLSDIPRGNQSKFLKDQKIPRACFQRQEDIENHPDFVFDPKKPDGMVLLGAIGDKLYGVRDDRHLSTFAGTRAGKTVTIISNHYFYNGNTLNNDSKGTIAKAVAKRRAAIGHKQYILDPYQIIEGDEAQFRCRFNPLKSLKITDIDVIENAYLIVDALVVETGNESDPHWNESAKNVLLGLILYVAFGENVPEKKRHLGTVRTLLNMAQRKEESEPDAEGNTKKGYVLRRLVSTGIRGLYEDGHDDIAEAIGSNIFGLYEMGKEEMPSVLSSTKRHTAFLQYRGMRDVLSGHDFDLEDLKREKIDIYLVLPQRVMQACNRWNRLFYTMLPAAMERETSKPEAPVLVTIDEFATLGRMPVLEDAIGRLAGHDVKVWTVMQDFSQGEALYKKRFESFLANSGVTQVFGTVDEATNGYVSKRLGKTSIEMLQTSDKSHDQMEKGQHGKSQSMQLFDLMTNDEIARYFARDDQMKRQLLLVAGRLPLITQRVEYWNTDAPYHHYFK
jgi:type IV secretion system protein VirD4